MADEPTKTVRKASTGNGKKPKPAKAARAAPLTLAEIETMAGEPVNFSAIYDKTDEAVRKKLFAVAAAQQLRDFVNQARIATKARPALGDLDLAAAIQNWAPIMKRRGKSPLEKASKFVGSMSAEERAEMLRLLQQ